MRNIFILILSVIALQLFSQDRIVTNEQLEKKGDQMYVIGEDEPYSGKCFTKYKSGQKGMAGKYVEGRKEGDWVWWYKNGNKKRVTQYVSGIKNGKSIYYYKNGVKKTEMIFENNKNIKQMCWDENGNRIPNPTLEQFR